MPNIFKKRILDEKLQDFQIENFKEKIEIAKKWHDDYHNGTLKTDKETSREQAFNQDFFIKILGYQEKPHSPYTLEPKQTTEKGQLPDVVLGHFDNENKQAVVVVELKGASIPLNRPQRRDGNMSPIQQAFKYKNQYRSCPFVLASNFFEFRLFQDNQLDYEIWNLDNLINPENDFYNFKKFCFLLQANHLIVKEGKSKIEELLSDIRIDEENISKSFYKEYKELRLELLRDIYQNNEIAKTNIDLAIEKAQKVIDRIVFVCFCEDKGLLPEHILQQVLKSSENSFGSLWSNLKGFFEQIDKGSKKLEIPDGYNGGLFARDNDLNQLEISDDILKKFVQLGVYNFEEDMSVSILGHIFEQSISDLEEIKSKANSVSATSNEQGSMLPCSNGDSDEQNSIYPCSSGNSTKQEILLPCSKKESKRKKDGIFYTPDYIVNYIIKNSLGKFLLEKEEDLKQKYNLKEDIQEETYEKRERLVYDEYRKVLEDVKVLDPACGSGAFLVGVFDFLLAENKRVNDILGGDLFSQDGFLRSILRNNIYGVDINQESVEITKLSLWLKTAVKGKKLTSLDGNIKCGNSLVSDVLVARERAFDWHEEFPEIIKKYKVTIDNNILADYFDETKPSHKKAKLLFSDNRVQLYVTDTVLRENYGNLDDIVKENIKNKVEKEKYILKSLIKSGQLKKINDRPCGFFIGAIPADGGTVISEKALENREKDLYKRYGNVKNMKKAEFKIKKRTELKNDYAIADAHRRINNDFILTNNIKDFKENKDLKVVGYDELFEALNENGFDIVLGNPPYFNIQTLGAKSEIAQNIQENYPEIWQDKSDIIFYFIAKSIQLTKSKVCFIVSNAFMFSDKARKLRNYILDNSSVDKITNFEKYMVFDDASITTAIIELDKNKSDKNTLAYSFKEKNYKQDEVSQIMNNKKKYFEVELKKDNVFALVKKKIADLNKKIDRNYEKLNDTLKIGKGMETAANKVFLFKEYPKQFPKEFVKKRMSGEIIKKYKMEGLKEYILYFEDVDNFEDLPKSIQDHLLENKEFLENRADKKRRKTSKWWNYTFPMHREYYDLNKIWCSYRAKENVFCFDNTQNYIGLTNTTVIFDTNENIDLKYLVALLNSSALNFRYKSIGKQTGSGVYEYFENGVGKLPIPEISKDEQQPFINLVDEILEAKQKIEDYKNLLTEATESNNFDREIKLKKEIENLESKVSENEKGVDDLVYELYGLSAEEIKIVENKMN